MTYNVFGGMLNIAQLNSVNMNIESIASWHLMTVVIRSNIQQYFTDFAKVVCIIEL